MFLDKISVRPIVSEHIETLRDYGTDKLSITDIVVFFGLPAALAVGAVWIGIRVRVSAVSAILTASAIFIGLLPSLLVLVLSFLTGTQGEADDQSLQTRKRFMREIAVNVSFAFVLSLVVAIIATTVLVLLPNDSTPSGITGTFLLVYGSTALALTLLMLIRRMHILVTTEFDRHKFNAPARNRAVLSR